MCGINMTSDLQPGDLLATSDFCLQPRPSEANVRLAFVQRLTKTQVVCTSDRKGIGYEIRLRRNSGREVGTSPHRTCYWRYATDADVKAVKRAGMIRRARSVNWSKVSDAALKKILKLAKDGKD